MICYLGMGVGGKTHRQLSWSKPSFPGLDLISAEPGWLQSCSQEPELPTCTFLFHQKHSHQEPAGAWHQVFCKRCSVPGSWEDILIFLHPHKQNRHEKAKLKGNFNCV